MLVLFGEDSSLKEYYYVCFSFIILNGKGTCVHGCIYSVLLLGDKSIPTADLCSQEQCSLPRYFPQDKKLSSVISNIYHAWLRHG